MLIDDLRQALPDGRLVEDPGVAAGFVNDEAEWAPYGTPASWCGHGRRGRCARWCVPVYGTACRWSPGAPAPASPVANTVWGC
ncbi:hypothetical protein CFP59_08041 [Streptomyces malaysiensis subsp. malaysiensis]|nr:hypothetical protein CFP59_08041 [Streptomyces sp. M56]